MKEAEDFTDEGEDGRSRIITVALEHAGQRLDKVLALLCDDLSRARIQGLIEDGEVEVDGDICRKPSIKLAGDEEIILTVPAPVAAIPLPQNIPLDIVYEDEHLLVINKQAGLVVHPGAGNPDGTLVNALLHHCGDSLSGIGGVLRPGIVHRLDKDTSGLMIVAKNDAAHQGLSAQLSDRSLSRVYLALVMGTLMPRKGVIDKPIGRDPKNRQKMAVTSKNSRDAVTGYQVLEEFGGALSLVECRLQTGRTHQIRVHLSQMGHPLVGDQLYPAQPTALKASLRKGGYEDEAIAELTAFPRQALHAAAISFIHPETDDEMDFEADLPDDFSNILNLLK